MRDHAQSPTTFYPLDRQDAVPRSSRQDLDSRLTAAADATARALRPVAVGWPADHFGSLVYAEALVRLKAALPRGTFEAVRRHYHTHRAAFLARLRRRAD
jgi:hypothetical protein